MLTLKELKQAFPSWKINKDATFTNVVTDSRHVTAGSLFVAIKGERVDGHDFLAQVKQEGAAAALVSREMPIDLPQIIVPHVVQALGELSEYWRKKLTINIAALTGSCGKTSTREMLASIMRSALGSAAVFSSPKNYNSDVGAPLSLLMLNASHQCAILEMGMNRAGEIADNSHHAAPIQVVGIVSIAAVHTEFFSDGINGVAKAKAEIFLGLNDTGMAVLPHVSEFMPLWRSLLKPSQGIMTFGVEQDADICITNIRSRFEYCQFALTVRQETVNIKLKFPGEHNAYNAACAAGMAYVLGASLADIKRGLEAEAGVARRLQHLKAKKGAVIIDDAYNANPKAVMSAIDVLAQFPGKKILVFGAMRELGENEQQYHIEVGEYAKLKEIDALYAVGDLTQFSVKAFGDRAIYFTDREQMKLTLRALDQSNTCLLIKGSASMNMKEFLEILL